MVGLLHEAGIHFHLPAEHRLHLRIDRVPRRYLRMPLRELAILGDDAELLLARKGLLAKRVPTLIELALVLVGPFLGHVMRRVCRTGCVVDEERSVRGQRFLLTDPADSVIGEVFIQRVTLLGCLHRLDASRPLEQVWIVLMRFTADEAIEVLEAAAAGRPVIERTDRAAFP